MSSKQGIMYIQRSSAFKTTSGTGDLNIKVVWQAKPRCIEAV